MTHICVCILTIIGSDNGLSPGRRQAIIWTSAGILLIGSLGTNFSEILIGIQIFSFKKMKLKMSSAKCRPFCLGLNVLRDGESKVTISYESDFHSYIYLFTTGLDRFVAPRLMMTSSNGNSFRVTGHLCGEFTRHRRIPRTKASDAELWCFLWSAPE